MSDPAEAGAATTGRYRGQDRRALEEPDRSAQAARAARWTLVAIGLAVVVVAVALTTASGMAGTEALAHLARGAALSLSLTLALGAQLFWRVSGVAAGFRLAAAGWLLGVALLIEVVDLHTVGPGAAAAVILHLSAALCAGHAAVGPEVDSGGGVLRQLATVGVPGVVAWLLGAVAVLSLSISGAQVMVAGCLLLAGTWAGVAVVGALRRPRSDPQPSWWLTGLAGGLATATLTRGLNGLLAADLSLTAAVLGVTALLIGAAGVYRALGHSAEVRRRALHRAQRAQRRSLDRRELADRELRHEARNALLAIEGAARTLRQQREHLDEQQRERLDHALANGIGHLHDLVLGDAEDQSTPVPVPVGDIVEQRAALTRTRGVEVEVDSRASHPNPRVLGHRRWLAQIVDNLLSNVEQHAVGDDGTPAARIAICADVAEVRVQVSDDGPGLPPGAHELVFARGYRGTNEAAGEGLGLAVARRLARELGGDLEARPSSRGACLELRLPLAVEAVGEVGDERGEIRDTLHLDTLDQDPATTAGAGTVVEDDGDIGGRGRGRGGGDHGVVADGLGRGTGADDRDDGDVVEHDAQGVVEQRRRGRYGDVRGHGSGGNHA